MASLQGLALGRKDVLMLDPRILLERDGWNVREESEELDEHVRTLAESIREQGVLEPLTVVMIDGKPYVTNGHCRLRAVRLLLDEGVDIKAVPTRPEDPRNNEGDHLLSQIVRNSGKPLSPTEKAEVFRRLEKYGWPPEDIARKSGVSLSTVERLLALSSATPATKKLVKDGKVSATTASREIKKSTPEEAEAKLTAAAKESPTGAVKPKDLTGKKSHLSPKQQKAAIKLLQKVADTEKMDALKDVQSEVAIFLEENGL